MHRLKGGVLKNIVWVSRHVQQDNQVEQLNEWTGGVNLKDYHFINLSQNITSVEDEILPLVTEDTLAIVAVLPVNLVSRLMKKVSCPVLKPIMERDCSEGRTMYNHRHFEQYKEIRIKTVRIT